MIFDNISFNKSILESIENYKKFGARSTKKLIPIHNYCKLLIKSIFKEKNFQVKDLTDGEKIVEGKYYNKKIDITVAYKDIPILCFGIKFITSNYKQNSMNYFENMIGETANIQSKKIPYFHLIIFRNPMPYFKRNGDIKYNEKITIENLYKYIKLSMENDVPHKPKFIGIKLVNISQDEDRFKVSDRDIDEIFYSSKYKNFYNKYLSIEKLFNEIKKYYVNFKKLNGI